MSQFTPNEAKVAIAPITAKPAGMACEAEIFLGPDDMTKVATSNKVPFVSTGVSQKVRLPITMPQEGTYHGYIDVFTEDVRFLAYKAKEDVVISVAVAEFAYVSAIRQIKYEDHPGQPWSHHCLKVEIDVKNIGDVAGICSVQAEYACAEVDWAWQNLQCRAGGVSPGCLKEATIEPGQTVTFYDSTFDSPAYGFTCKLRFTGDPSTTSEVRMI